MPIQPRSGWLGRWDAFLELLFPAHCVACGRARQWLCDTCLMDIPGQRSLELVTRQQAIAAGLSGALALSPHRRPLRGAIHAFKYDGLRVLAEPLAELLSTAWRAMPLPVDVVMPVPLHSAQLRQRGYNQAELLAHHFCANTGLLLLPDALIRCRQTRSQVGLSPQERQNNVAGAFYCPSGQVGASRVLLIDDVHTTGATLAACAKALHAAGAADVWGLTLTWAASSRGRFSSDQSSH